MLFRSVGMLAGAVGRLLTSSFYALNDTRTPLRFAVVRIVLTLVLGYAAAVWLPTWLGFDARWGTAGLTASAGVAGWVEFVLLRRALTQRLGTFAMPRGHVPKLWLAAVSAAGVAWALLWLLHPETLGGLLRTLAACLHAWIDLARRSGAEEGARAAAAACATAEVLRAKLRAACASAAHRLEIGRAHV